MITRLSVAEKIHKLGVEAGNIAKEISKPSDSTKLEDRLDDFLNVAKQWGKSIALLSLAEAMLENEWWEELEPPESKD